jgi:hypothetical protein
MSSGTHFLIFSKDFIQQASDGLTQFLIVRKATFLMMPVILTQVLGKIHTYTDEGQGGS